MSMLMRALFMRQGLPARYVEASSATAASGGVEVSTPVSLTRVGDLLLFIVIGEINTTGNITYPTVSGWTLLLAQPSNSLSLQPAVYVFYRVMTGTEASTYTATPDITCRSAAAIVALRGVNPATLRNGTVESNYNTTSITASTVTAAANGLLLFVGSQSNNNQGMTEFTPPADMTECVDIRSVGATNTASLTIAYQEDMVAGATGDKTAISNISASTTRYRAVLITVDAG